MSGKEFFHVLNSTLNKIINKILLVLMIIAVALIFGIVYLPNTVPEEGELKNRETVLKQWTHHLPFNNANSSNAVDSNVIAHNDGFINDTFGLFVADSSRERGLADDSSHNQTSTDKDNILDKSGNSDPEANTDYYLSDSTFWIYIFGSILVIIVGWIVFLKTNNHQKAKEAKALQPSTSNEPLPMKPSDTFSSSEETSAARQKASRQRKKEKAIPAVHIVAEAKKDVDLVKVKRKQGSEIPAAGIPLVKEHNWLVVGASATGKSHSMMNIPCQDYFQAKSISRDWGIVACCDGAGSAKESHKGAQFIADKAVAFTWEMFDSNFWPDKKRLPSLEEWQEASVGILKKVVEGLENFARFEEVDPKSMASTLILLVYSPFGLLMMHVGDGRAGYKDQEGNWKAMLSPYKGKEANETVFVTSQIWDQLEEYVECQVIDDPPVAFAVMTDGSESHAFKTLTKDDESQKYYDVNEPYPNFLNPLLMAVKDMSQAGMNTNQIEQELKRFLENGTRKLQDELDDKTLVIGQLK
ncbi:MAG: protein phosphatase 2C domain-containing protein [Lewinellaceae bacterium]|nr:protein phosphatase 2C domain-containing protein [Lewinellaceae bacterium]